MRQPLLLPKASGVRTHLENYFSALDGTPAPAFDSASTDTVLGLVEAGHGVCLMPDVFVSVEVRDRFAGVRFLRVASGPRPLELGITLRAGWRDAVTAAVSSEVIRAAHENVAGQRSHLHKPPAPPNGGCRHRRSTR
jgi:DNA-binding transcriptional LysR family regulator